MFGDLNRAEIIGNITNDLQVRYTSGGSAVVSFGVATNRSYKAQGEDSWKEETTFHNVVVWGNQAEMLADRARKGTRIFVSGRLQTRSWDDAEGKKNYKTEIISSEIILLDRYEKGSQGNTPAGNNNAEEKPAKAASKSSKKAQTTANAEDGSIDPDDLPF